MRYSALLALLPAAFAAPLVKVKRDDVIEGKFIVKLVGDISTFAETELKNSLASTPDHEYTIPGFRGFAGSLSSGEVAQLQASSQVCSEDPWLTSKLIERRSSISSRTPKSTAPRWLNRRVLRGVLAASLIAKRAALPIFMTIVQAKALARISLILASTLSTLSSKAVRSKDLNPKLN